MLIGGKIEDIDTKYTGIEIVSAFSPNLTAIKIAIKLE